MLACGGEVGEGGVGEWEGLVSSMVFSWIGEDEDGCGRWVGEDSSGFGFGILGRWMVDNG